MCCNIHHHNKELSIHQPHRVFCDTTRNRLHRRCHCLLHQDKDADKYHRFHIRSHYKNRITYLYVHKYQNLRRHDRHNIFWFQVHNNLIPTIIHYFSNIHMCHQGNNHLPQYHQRHLVLVLECKMFHDHNMYIHKNLFPLRNIYICHQGRGYLFLHIDEQHECSDNHIHIHFSILEYGGHATNLYLSNKCYNKDHALHIQSTEDFLPKDVQDMNTFRGYRVEDYYHIVHNILYNILGSCRIHIYDSKREGLRMGVHHSIFLFPCQNYGTIHHRDHQHNILSPTDKHIHLDNKFVQHHNIHHSRPHNMLLEVHSHMNQYKYHKGIHLP